MMLFHIDIVYNRAVRIYNDPEVGRIWYGFNPATEKKTCT